VALATWAKPTAARFIIAGGAGCSLMLLMGQAAVLGAALGVRSGASDGVTRGADNLSAALLDLSSLPAVLLFAGAATTLFTSAGGPRWLAWLTALGAPLAVLDALSYDSGPLEFFGIIGLAYFLIWSLLSAVTLIYIATRDSTPLDHSNQDAGERVTTARR
jgi:hypothetical protein